MGGYCRPSRDIEPILQWLGRELPTSSIFPTSHPESVGYMIPFFLKSLKINRCFPDYYLTLNIARYQLLKYSPAGCKAGFSSSPLRMMGSSQALEEALKALNLQSSTPNSQNFPDFYPEYNPLDIYRAHIAHTLSDVTGVAAGNIYPFIQWTQSLIKGDMVLPVPALRVKGGKPTDLAQTWAKEVNFAPCFRNARAMLINTCQAATNQAVPFLVSELAAC